MIKLRGPKTSHERSLLRLCGCMFVDDPPEPRDERELTRSVFNESYDANIATRTEEGRAGGCGVRCVGRGHLELRQEAVAGDGHRHASVLLYEVWHVHANAVSVSVSVSVQVRIQCVAVGGAVRIRVDGWVVWVVVWVVSGVGGARRAGRGDVHGVVDVRGRLQVGLDEGRGNLENADVVLDILVRQLAQPAVLLHLAHCGTTKRVNHQQSADEQLASWDM